MERAPINLLGWGAAPKLTTDLVWDKILMRAPLRHGLSSSFSFSLTVSQTLKGSSRLKGFQCHWGGVRLQAGGGPGRVRSRAWYGNTRYPICTAKSSGTKFVLWSLAVKNSSCEASGTKFVLRSVAELNLYCKVLRYTIGTARIQ